MDNSLYELAEVLVCDPVALNRTATPSALYSLGYRHVELVVSLRDFSEALERHPPDFAICDTQVGETPLCAALRELRQNSESYNPFVIIIITAWATTATFTADISGAGADGLLLRPYSASRLDERIRAHVLHRKPFVVTPNYVGPERRAAGRRPSDGFSFDPPNSLKTKIDGRADAEKANRRFEAELKAARETLSIERQRRRTLSMQT